jgi:hypothetical protein
MSQPGNLALYHCPSAACDLPLSLDKIPQAATKGPSHLVYQNQDLMFNTF